MRIIVAACVVLATAVASPAFAAAKHRAPVQRPAVSYGEPVGNAYLGSSDVVTFGGHVVGEDPDASIRTQLLFDPSLADN
jgi:hypothetical protein